MSFEKRVCVLKQVKKGFTADGSALSGAVYAERIGTELTVIPRLLGIAPVREGRYALALGIDGEVLIAELREGGVRMQSPSIKSGMAVLLVYVRGEAEAVAFGNCGTASADYAPLLAAFQKSEERKKRPPMPAPTPLPPTELPTFSPNNVPLAPAVPLPGEDASPFREEDAKYNDEAIADGNYYEDAHDGDGEAGLEEAAPQKAAHDGAPTAEDDGAVHPLLVGGGLTYYNSVREKLRAAFAKFPRDDRLRAVYPASEWVKTDGGLLGIIYKDGSPEFLCVAAEANGEPPEEMKAHCQFVPATPFSDMVGFYVVYQSASTGEYVTVSDS